MKYHILQIHLFKVSRKISLGREIVPLDNPYIYFLFLLGIAPRMGPQSREVCCGCMFYMPYICVFYLQGWIRLHRYFCLSITVLTSCVQLHLGISFWHQWAVVKLTCSVLTLSKRPHHISFQECKSTQSKRTEATTAYAEWESHACFQNWKSHSEVSDVLERNPMQSPMITSSYEHQVTEGLWIKNCSSGLRRYATSKG